VYFKLVTIRVKKVKGISFAAIALPFDNACLDKLGNEGSELLS
jgi:hypothetical protein